MNNEVLQNIRTRRSCRAYTAQPVEPEKLKAILEAGTWAASGMGRQAPKIVVLTDPAEIAELERMGNLLLAAHSLGVASCWIHQAREEFDSPEGKALLKKWGVDERYIGVGHCILGYAASEAPAPKPRKKDYVINR